jgi:uncharacterized protein
MMRLIPGFRQQGGKKKLNWQHLLMVGLGVSSIGYAGCCLYLYLNQGQMLYKPRRDLFRLPSDPQIRLRYEELLIPIADRENLHGWWLPAPTASEPPAMRQEPSKILQSPKVLLFFYGRAGNKSSVLFRLQALHQLGFSILVVDYRGFGASGGNFPTEHQMYADAELAWQYLTKSRQINPGDIAIYGESMGGAVAIDLASKHPDAFALIAQSTFTTMSDAARQNPTLRWLPIELLLTDRFSSIDKLPNLKIPVLFIHGTSDAIVKVGMSERLYRAAPSPKQLYLVPGGGHIAIYQPEFSYLRAISEFMTRSHPRTSR